MADKSIRQVIMRMTHPSRIGFVLNGEVVDALATAVEEYVAEHYVEKPTPRGGCPTCGGKWTRSGPPRKPHPDDQIASVNLQPALISGRTGNIIHDDRTCADEWHQQFFPQGRRTGY